MKNKNEIALRDYRQLMRLMANDSTLNDAQMAQLALSQEVLGLTEFDTEEDLEALHRHADLAEALEGTRARHHACAQTIKTADETIQRCVEELEEAQRQRQEAQECYESSQAEMAELLNLEQDNPRIFPNDTE